MYVRGGARLRVLAWNDRWTLATLLGLALLTEWFAPLVPELELFSAVFVGILSTALSIFLVFRFNESYERWWEARKLWGRLVNLSRDYTRQVLSLLGESFGEQEKRRMVERQIAFVHALRIRLREGPSDRGREQVGRELRRVLAEEADELLGKQNIPSAILLRQSQVLARGLRDTTSNTIILAQLEASLAALHDVQGGCERIKNTIFPDSVSLLTRSLVWAMALLLMLATISPDGRGGVVPTIAVSLVAMGYIWIDGLSRDLKDPFEDTANDTPMSSLCVTIERDLKEMLGDDDLPPPVEPLRGVLM